MEGAAPDDPASSKPRLGDARAASAVLFLRGALGFESGWGDSIHLHSLQAESPIDLSKRHHALREDSNPGAPRHSLRDEVVLLIRGREFLEEEKNSHNLLP